MIYTHPEHIMKELAGLTPSYVGISYERLEGDGQVWPCPAPDHPGTPLLHAESFPRGKGRFVPVSSILPEEDADDEYPFVLITGRRLVHYNNASMTRRSEGFGAISDRELVEIHPKDASALGIRDGDTVRVESRRGAVEVRAMVTDRSRPGTVFMSFHFSETLTNLLTSPGMDTKTLTPEYKVCAVRIRI
jgi:predicted molibdopterin-dependent oxidoreductase YjgC